MFAHRSPRTFQVSDQISRLIEALGVAFDLTNADVLARAVAELAERAGLAVAAADEPPPRPRRPPADRTVADPPGPIGDR